jgi:hypothetical protein
VLKDGARVFEQRNVARMPVPLALPLLLFALLLFPLDVGARRLLLTGSQAREIWDETRAGAEAA